MYVTIFFSLIYVICGSGNLMHYIMQLLERHFGAAMSEASRQQVDLAKQHAAVVIACLNAINAYAEWAPVLDLSRYGIING